MFGGLAGIGEGPWVLVPGLTYILLMEYSGSLAQRWTRHLGGEQKCCCRCSILGMGSWRDRLYVCYSIKQSVR
jgi:hypothetical protein